MPRLAAALRSEILTLTQPALGKLARTLDSLRQAVEDLRDNVHQNGQALARLEQKPARDGRRTRGRRPAQPASVAPAPVVAGSSRFSPKAVRALRASLALSRVRFAKLLGVSPGSIFGWEKGRTLPGRSSLARLATLGRGPSRGPGRPPGSKNRPASGAVGRRPRRRGRRARG